MVYTFEDFFGEGDLPRISASTSLHLGKVNVHTHTYYELVFVLNGFSLHFCSGKTTLLTAGDMFIIQPGIEHSFATPYCNGVLNFMFCLEDFADAFDAADNLPGLPTLNSTPTGDPPILHVDISERRSIESTFEKIRMERQSRPAGWRTSLRTRMVSLLLKYSRLYEEQYAHADRSLTGSYSYVLRILQYVEQNYTTDIRLEHLAEVAGLNPDYISRKFKNAMGMSPSEYVRKFRVAKAMELLQTRDMSVAAIASACGFADVCLFSRVFKNTTGITPIEYRRHGFSDFP